MSEDEYGGAVTIDDAQGLGEFIHKVRLEPEEVVSQPLPWQMVYVDMDGVVADFDQSFKWFYGVTISESDQKTLDKFWNVDCVFERFFAKLSGIKEGFRMLRALEGANIPFTFMTSTGGGLHHLSIAKQKLDFISRFGIKACSIAFCCDTRGKTRFAGPGRLLIDDRQSVVDAWRLRGGEAVLFTPDRWDEIVELCVGGVHS